MSCYGTAFLHEIAVCLKRIAIFWIKFSTGLSEHIRRHINAIFPRIKDAGTQCNRRLT